MAYFPHRAGFPWYSYGVNFQRDIGHRYHGVSASLFSEVRVCLLANDAAYWKDRDALAPCWNYAAMSRHARKRTVYFPYTNKTRKPS